jgi:hypothetical protein
MTDDPEKKLKPDWWLDVVLADARRAEEEWRRNGGDKPPPGDPWNNPEDRKEWVRQGWHVERYAAFKQPPGVDLTKPFPDEPPPLSEEHQRQVCRFLDIPYEPEKSARIQSFVRWKRLNKAAMDAEDRKRFGLIEVLSPAPARPVATPASPRVYLLPAPAPEPPEPAAYAAAIKTAK